MSVYAAEWGTVPDWLMLAVTVASAGVAVAAVIYGRRQAASAGDSVAVAAESRDIAAQARDEARRAADASEKSAQASARLSDVEARRDHRLVAKDIELVKAVNRKGSVSERSDRVVTLRNNGTHFFQYKARVFFSETSHSEVGFGTWRPGAEVDLWLGTNGQDFSHIEVWLDGECPCDVPDGVDGHWRVSLPVPPPRVVRVLM
ncbi:hypothetical protein K1W54_04215 [Micromonospora sp. CPCC 205371]|nr:hypothetical protein [Micromonospora sp. CPCC 205371]